MKTWMTKVVASGVLVACLLGVSMRPELTAQESGKSAKAEKGDAAKGKKKGSSVDRLPAPYGKIGLSEEQRKKIYDIQNKYEPQIDELEKKIEDLKKQQAAEVETVLTANQKAELVNLRDEAKKKAAEGKKKSE